MKALYQFGQKIVDRFVPVGLQKLLPEKQAAFWAGAGGAALGLGLVVAGAGLAFTVPMVSAAALALEFTTLGGAVATTALWLMVAVPAAITGAGMLTAGLEKTGIAAAAKNFFGKLKSAATAPATLDPTRMPNESPYAAQFKAESTAVVAEFNSEAEARAAAALPVNDAAETKPATPAGVKVTHKF